MRKLAALQFKTTDDFEKNLQKMTELYQKSDSFITVAPEVSLTGFAYDRMEEADAFSKEAIKRLCGIVGKKALVLTVIEKRDGGFYNCVKVIQHGNVIHQQTKHILFRLGSEHEHFRSGEIDDIKTFEIDKEKVAILVCFELRFTQLWKKIEDADIILLPAMWGKPRAEHLAILSTALAVANRAYVVVSDSANEDMAKESAVITPWGVRTSDNNEELIEKEFDPKEIKRIKRAIPYE